MPTSLVDLLVTCGREVVDKEEEKERDDGEIYNVELVDLTQRNDE